MKDHKLVPLRPPESILAVVRKAYGNATAYDVGHVWHEIYTRLPDAAPVQEQQPAPASKPVLLQCLGCERVGTQEQLSASTDCDCWKHSQPAPVQEQQPVAYLMKHGQWSTNIETDEGMWLLEQFPSEDVQIPVYLAAQPRKAVKLSDSEILAALEVEYVSSAQNRHLFLSDARIIEAAVWAKLGVEK